MHYIIKTVRLSDFTRDVQDLNEQLNHRLPLLECIDLVKFIYQSDRVLYKDGKPHVIYPNQINQIVSELTEEFLSSEEPIQFVLKTIKIEGKEYKLFTVFHGKYVRIYFVIKYE